LIATLVTALGLALLLGIAATRMRLPALVGYLLAGVIIGPFTPGYVANLEIAAELAEIGVMLLMFGVGLHFSLDDLLAVRRIAVPGAVVQMAVATALGAALAAWWGWSTGAALVFGLALSVASTVVLLKALEAQGLLDTPNGRIAIGWLVVEDLAMVLVLVMLPALAGVLGGDVPDAARDVPLWRTVGWTLIEVSAFIALMLVAGRRVLPWLLWQIARTGSRELFTLAVVATAIGIAFGAAELFSVSFALGAFFAGMVMRESEFSHRAADESLPLRDAFAVLFFVSIGMLFDPAVLLERPLQVAATVAIIVLGKSVAAMALVVGSRYPLRTAMVVSASLAQIGEFSFILAGLGVTLGLLPPEGLSLIVAGSLISIAVNPLLMATHVPVADWLVARSAWVARLDGREDRFAALPADTALDRLHGQVVLVGCGRVGRGIADSLEQGGIPFVVVDRNRERVEQLRERGIAAVSGNAADPVVLVQAHVARAALLVIAIPDTVSVRPMVDTARALNPGIEIVVRAHGEAESRFLRQDGIGTVFSGEEELARSMVAHVLDRFAAASLRPTGSPRPDGAGHRGAV
jgi:CPA2 family monovalent cation:H+ antiporter-2